MREALDGREAVRVARTGNLQRSLRGGAVMTVSQSQPQVFSGLPTVVSLAIGITCVLVVTGVVAGVLAAIPLSPGLVYSGLAWTLLAAALAVLAFIAWRALPRTAAHTMHAKALVCVPVAATLVGMSANSSTVALLFVLGSLAGIALAGRWSGRYRTAVLVLCAVGGFGVAAFALLGLVFGVLDSRMATTTHFPAVTSADGRLSAVATVVREGAMGSDFEFVVVAATGPHLLEQKFYVDDASVGDSAVWIGPRTLRVGQKVVRVTL